MDNLRVKSWHEILSYHINLQKTRNHRVLKSVLSTRPKVQPPANESLSQLTLHMSPDLKQTYSVSVGQKFAIENKTKWRLLCLLDKLIDCPTTPDLSLVVWPVLRWLSPRTGEFGLKRCHNTLTLPHVSFCCAFFLSAKLADCPTMSPATANSLPTYHRTVTQL